MFYLQTHSWFWQLLHCGCIVSIPLLELLDCGGVSCINCAKKSGISPVRSVYIHVYIYIYLCYWNNSRIYLYKGLHFFDIMVDLVFVVIQLIIISASKCISYYLCRNSYKYFRAHFLTSISIYNVINMCGMAYSIHERVSFQWSSLFTYD